MTEEEIGDAVHAGVSEGALGFAGIGTIGHGAGGGGGSGYGSGYGRGSRVPQVRSGSASTSAFRGLARVMRERFPATLLFRPSVELDAAGHARVDVRLADAVTSYIVETIVWRTDGWIWSSDTRIEVEREVVVEAPIPEIARSDDAIALPVRVSNHGRAARTLVVSVLESPELGIEAGELRTIEVGAGDAGVTAFIVRPTREGAGHVRVAVATPEGEALDAIQMPLEVVRRARRVRRTVEMLAVGRGVLTLEIPSDATTRTGELEVHVGEGLIAPAGSPLFQRWAHEAGDPREAVEEMGVTADDVLPWRVGARWRSPDVDERAMSEAIDRLSQTVDRIVAEEADPISRTSSLSRLLLALAPTVDTLDSRPSGARLGELVARTRALVSENAAQLTDEAGPLVLAAAALAWTARGTGNDVLAQELARRAERSVIVVGEDVFVASAADPVGASAMLAMADARLGRSERVLALVSTLSRWDAGGRDDERRGAHDRARRDCERRGEIGSRERADGHARWRGRAEAGGGSRSPRAADALVAGHAPPRDRARRARPRLGARDGDLRRAMARRARARPVRARARGGGRRARWDVGARARRAQHHAAHDRRADPRGRSPDWRGAHGGEPRLHRRACGARPRAER